MQPTFHETICLKLLYSDEKDCLIKTLIYKVLNGSSKLEQKKTKKSHWRTGPYYEDKLQ